MNQKLRECLQNAVVDLLKEKDSLVSQNDTETNKKQIDALDNVINSILFCLVNY